MARRNLQFDAGEMPYAYGSGAALAAGGVIAADGPARLFNITVTSENVSDQYVLLFDAAAVPADGAAAAAAFKVPAGTTARLDFGSRGKAFQNGICWSNSSTLPTKTAGSADCFAEANWQ